MRLPGPFSFPGANLHEFFLDLRRIGIEFRNQYGETVAFVASIFIIVSASLSIAAKVWRGLRFLWRRKRKEAAEEDFPEGS